MVEYNSRMERRRAMQKQKNKNAQHGQKPNPTKKNRKKGFKRVALICLLLFLFFILASMITVFAIIKNAPALDPKMLKDPISSQIMDKNGKMATNVFNGNNRTYSDIDKIPKNVQNAFISTEDARFYQHFGIDPYRIGGAVVAQFKKGFGSEGASTITQQVVRNSFLTQKKQMTRKIQEAYLAIKLEQKYTKKQILEMYLNKIYLGAGATYGVSNASKLYFGKNIQDVNLPQAAMLAAMTRNPGYYDPLRQPKHAKQRRDLVLDLMVQHQAISKEEAEKAKEVSIKEMTKGHAKVKQNKTKYSAYVDYLYKELVEDKKVISANDFYNGGLKIYTSLDPAIQSRVEEVLDNENNFPGVKHNFQAGISIVDTKTGSIQAIGGARNYVKGNFNYATSDSNNIGSTAKPIIDYGPAVEYMHWATNHTVDDTAAEAHYSGGQSFGNWNSTFEGPMTMRRALARSRNVPAVQTLKILKDQVGDAKIKQFTKKLGIPLDTVYETYGIGAFGVSPLQLAGAYATFGNNGNYNQPYAAIKIEYPDGQIQDLDHVQHVAMHDYTAYMITDMLKDVVTSGTGTNANLPGVPLAGKTGTQNVPEEIVKKYNLSSYEERNGAISSWFVGYTTKYTASIWTGYSNSNDKNAGHVLIGEEQHYNQNLFKYIMSGFMQGSQDFKRPHSVIDIGGGELAVRGTQSEVRKEVEKDKDEAKKVDSPTGLNAQYNEASKVVSIQWNYDDDATFIVKQDGGPSTSTSNKQVTVQNVTPGRTYTFTVTAKTEDGLSKPASVAIKIPQAATTNPNENSNNQENNRNSNTNNNGNANNNGNNSNNGNTNNNENTNSNGNTDNSNRNNGNNPNNNQNTNENTNTTDDSNTSANNDKPTNGTEDENQSQTQNQNDKKDDSNKQEKDQKDNNQ
ncbi:PBP1A family penicillin-binding protein [Terrilactibacillus sp. BCM23-1]|uniref:PBP1A family penicillin-binding protein n=1 Tax=Terrilactibacillus tamarindi TaxID=2599694 RepID=A0A6N8CU30_9BACI|nr:penicillin-binding protein 1A [Terrilactibacillus tamarindi]MTT32613.1 PBP1A family penicillin-binding protein [Terrilactibacillus tamarindi]